MIPSAPCRVFVTTRFPSVVVTVRTGFTALAALQLHAGFRVLLAELRRPSHVVVCPLCAARASLGNWQHADKRLFGSDELRRQSSKHAVCYR